MAQKRVAILLVSLFLVTLLGVGCLVQPQDSTEVDTAAGRIADFSDRLRRVTATGSLPRPLSDADIAEIAAAFALAETAMQSANLDSAQDARAREELERLDETIRVKAGVSLDELMRIRVQ